MVDYSNAHSIRQHAAELYELRHKNIGMDPNRAKRLSIDAIDVALQAAYNQGYNTRVSEHRQMAKVIEELAALVKELDK